MGDKYLKSINLLDWSDYLRKKKLRGKAGKSGTVSSRHLGGFEQLIP